MDASPQFASALATKYSAAQHQIELNYTKLSKSIYEAIKGGKQEVKLTLDFAGATDSDIIRAMVPHLQKETWRRGVSLVTR